MLTFNLSTNKTTFDLLIVQFFRQSPISCGGDTLVIVLVESKKVQVLWRFGLTDGSN